MAHRQFRQFTYIVSATQVLGYIQYPGKEASFSPHLMKMFANESINICEATQSTVSLLELGKVEGFIIGTGLAIVAGIGLAIKALFIWYIQYRAPKDRPINKLIWYDQVCIVGIVCCIMFR